MPRGDVTIAQTFVAAHTGLSSVEVIAAVYPGAPTTAAFTLHLRDADGRAIATSTFSKVAHNAPLSLNFVPLPDSAGKTYTLQLEGTPDNGTTAWAYSLDGYARGALMENGAPTCGDLRFSTAYAYLWPDTLKDTIASLLRLASQSLPLWLILFAPGLLLLDGLFSSGVPSFSLWVRWGLALALSLSGLPLAWLWISIVGLRWSVGGLWAIYAIAGGAVIWRGLRRWRAIRPAIIRPRPSLHACVLALILFVTLVTRLLAARDLAFPAWVDSPHHYTIARVLAENGRVSSSYTPVLPVDHLSYHFGFHALAVTIHWLTSLSLTDTFLLFGQLLQGLMPLSVYTFTILLTARPRAGLLAAFVVGLISLFPGYYLTWGRYTQLTGLLILGPLLGLSWRVLASGPDGFIPLRVNETVLVGILAGGLCLTHYGLMIPFGTFVLVALAGGKRGDWKRMAAAGAVGGLLTLPWLWRLGAQIVPVALEKPAFLAASADYNAFPWDYFRGGLERGWLLAALVAAGWGLARRDQAVWMTTGWVAVTFAFLNIGSGMWLLPNHAWAIILFLPGVALLGWGGDHWLARTVELTSVGQHWGARTLGLAMCALFVGLLTYAGMQGLRAQVTIVNPVTVLATADDRAALDWVARNTPADAKFLVNGWLWLNGTWANSDGGGWIWPLTARETTLPPSDYLFQSEWWRAVNAFNARAAQIQDWNALEALVLLREAGVTHVFIGAKGGYLKPEMFVNRPSYRVVYTNGPVWIFEVTDELATRLGR